MITYEVHPLATLFPQIVGKVFDALVEDIRQHGLREPITLLDGKILDGRNRAAACHAAGVEPRFEEWQPAHDDDSPEAFVISRNLARRQLNDGQRAIIAARLADHPGSHTAGVPKGDKSGHITKAGAADLLNVTPSFVRMAREVVNKAPAEVVGKVERGEMKVGAAWRRYVDERRPAAAERRDYSTNRPAAPDDGKTLPELISDFIDMLRSRPRDVAQIGRDQRVAVAKDFAVALRLMADPDAAGTVTGSALASV